MIEVTKDIIGKSAYHKKYPEFYPKRGTVGVVTQWVSPAFGFVFVQWPVGTVSGNGIWGCQEKFLELYKGTCIKCV